MFEIEKIIGRIAHMKEIYIINAINDDCISLFRSLDVVEPEMQDYSIQSKSIEGELFMNDQFKLKFESKKIELTDDVLVHLGKEVEACLIPLHLERNVGSIKAVLPQRNTSAFIRVYADEREKELQRIVADNDAVIEQVKEFSVKHFGCDITSAMEYIGDTVLICYNPIYKSIDLKEDGKNPGLYFRVNYWKAHREQLAVDITGKEKNGTLLWQKSFLTTKGVFLSRFDFERNCPLLDIDVKDSEGRTLDYFKDVSFIHSISVNVEMRG